jgi:flagellar biosynthetic protein FliO
MRFDPVLATEAGQATGPDLTRYLVVCVGLIAAVLALAWVFRRTLGGRLRARAARRSLQVLDVLPLSGKQKLVVVRCYDRSFLLGTGEKEVRVIAELEVAPESRAESSALLPLAAPEAAAEPRLARAARSFGSALEGELARRPAPAPSLGSKEGILA